MDVYAPMFFCDLVTFLIVVFGYDKFGPSVNSLSFRLFPYFPDNLVFLETCLLHD